MDAATVLYDVTSRAVKGLISGLLSYFCVHQTEILSTFELRLISNSYWVNLKYSSEGLNQNFKPIRKTFAGRKRILRLIKL